MAEFTSITTISRELQGLTLTEVKRIDKQPLGNGSYGQVFAVKHWGKTYAAKQIHSILIEAVSPEEKRAVRDNFLKECHCCKDLDHPNIVRFIGVYYPDPHSVLPVMVMELMDTSLTEYVKTPNITMKIKVSILHDISQGLNFLHGRNLPIIHRDLSPNNVLLSRDPVAKISDLGVAKVVKAGTKNTKSKLTKAPGTTDFMSPEALTDDPKYSTSLDIFSYGGLTLQVVNQEWPTPTGATAFDPKLRQITGFTEVQRRQKYLDMMTVEAEVLKSLVIRCLDNDPEKRPTAAGVLEVLSKLKIQQGHSVTSDDKRKPYMEWSIDMEHTGQKEKFAILLDSAVGYKPSSWKEDTKDWVLGKQFTEKSIIGGTLLEALSEKEILVLASQFEPILNYKVISSEVSLHCKPKQIRTLNVEEVQYLQAVKSCNCRLEALPKLEWIGSLYIGSGAYLDMPAISNHPVKITILYIGNLPSADYLGTWFGVELLECRGQGTTNGYFQGYKLFKCSQNCGLFVSMEKLALFDPVVVTHQLPQKSRQSPKTDDKPFKKNDRVMAFDVNNSPEIGTVKWIGRNKEALPSGAYIVGIFLDHVISISDLKSRFPHKISMNHLIQTSINHTTVFLPVNYVKKFESQDSIAGSDGLGHKYDTRFQQQKRSYCNSQDVTTAIDAEAKRHGISPSAIKENQKEIFKEVEQRKEEVRRKQEKVESNKRRLNMQQIKQELQIGEIEGFDDTMLDRKRQEKILEDIKRQNKESQQNSSQVGKANVQQSVPESHPGYQHHQQQRSDHKISQQDPCAQDMYSHNLHPSGMGHSGMTQPGMGHPGMSQLGMGQPDMSQPSMDQQEIYWQDTYQQCTYPPSQNMPLQEIHPQGMFQREIHHRGIPQQDMYSQGMFHQLMPHKGLYPQGMNNSNMSQLDQYQRGVPHNYQSQQYNQPSNNSNCENAQYGMGRQQSFEFNQILRAEEADAPYNAHINDTPQIRPFEPYRQVEASHDMPALEVGDAIQSGNNPVSYGTIKWIGEILGCRGFIAGVEMEQPVLGATDGWHDGFQYFECERGKGMFLRLATLRRDDRYIDQTTVIRNPLGEFNLNNSIELKAFIQPPEKVVKCVHTGAGKGIQGHQNSCYLDSTLYGLFAFSGAFDDLFLKEATDEVGQTIKSILQTIVNTLRHDNVVLYEHIMILRDKLDKLQHIKGLQSDEKDPEEFVILLFKHILNVEAFLRIKRPFGTDKEFFVQLFVEEVDEHHIPKTQDLLTKMFEEQQITFEKYPLRLLLQIPRYGKQFKTFKGTIPSLELDVTTLCEQYVGNCVICGNQGTEFCADCEKEQQLKEDAYNFCKECVALWHRHRKRRHHKPVLKHPSSDGSDPGRLQLLSVLCIETSHYVCFTRVQGSGINEWVFFDSMAERPDDVHNIPQVTQCTQQLNEWVYGNKDLTKYTSKELPPLVRRFVEDGYLCIYVDQDGIMYGDDGDTL